MREDIYRCVLEQLERSGRTILLTAYSGQACRKKLLTEESAETSAEQQILKQVQESGMPVFAEQTDGLLFAEPFAAESRLLLLGGGHVALALAEFAAKTGFCVTVVDDRKQFANRGRFPWVQDVWCETFADGIRRFGVRQTDYVVTLTRGHQHDADCLRTLWAQPEKPCYLGMIGSRRRTTALKAMLAEEDRIDRDWLESIYTPVGLAIGAQTPEEIAVSILAELIQTKRQTLSAQMVNTDVELPVLEALAQAPELYAGQRRAVVTILSTKGSSPRKAGAKMILYEHGGQEGTIGGGCAEAELTGRGRRLLRSGRAYELCTVDMTEEAAASEGMVCGGTMQVLIENIDRKGETEDD